MRVMTAALFFSLSSLATYGHAQEPLTFSKLAADQDTRAVFHQMVRDHQLPEWVARGGTESQSHTVTVAGSRYVVMSMCKPHDCGAQRMAVMYATATKKIAGVFSSVDENTGSESMTWLDMPDELMIDGKTILYAALTGSLDNHPDGFNFD